MEDIFADDSNFVVVQPQPDQANVQDEEPLFVGYDDDAVDENDDAYNADVRENRVDGLNMEIGSADPSGHFGGNDDDDDDILGDVNLRGRRKLVVLSEDQLLSAHGLPYIKQNLQKRVKFSSSTQYTKVQKGNSNDFQKKKRVSFTTEYENATKLLQFYQLWAHRVFPKANFKDFMHICYYKKNLGKGRLPQYRKQWIASEQEQLFNKRVQMAEAKERAENELADLENTKQNDTVQRDNILSELRNANEPFFSDDEANAPITRSNGLFVADDESSDEEQNTIKEKPSSQTGNEHSQIDPPKSNLEINTSENTLQKSLNIHNVQSGTKSTHDINAENTTKLPGEDFDEDFDDDEENIEFWSQLDNKTRTSQQSQENQIPELPDLEEPDEGDHEDEMAILREMGL